MGGKIDGVFEAEEKRGRSYLAAVLVNSRPNQLCQGSGMDRTALTSRIVLVVGGSSCIVSKMRFTLVRNTSTSWKDASFAESFHSHSKHIGIQKTYAFWFHQKKITKKASFRLCFLPILQ